MKSNLILRPTIATVCSALITSAVFAACTAEDPGNTQTAGTGGATAASGGTMGGSGAIGGTSGGTAGSTTGGTGGAGGTGGGGAGIGGTTGGAGGTTGGAGGSVGGAGIGGIGAESGAGGGNPGGAGAGAVSGMGGDTSAGGSAGTAAGMSGSGGSAGSTAGTGAGGNTNTEGPCDIYAAANVPCVAAYSPVRRLYSEYTGPLYQLRKGGPDPNTGSGGETQDIPQLPNGFADVAAHEAFCGTTGTCTFSVLYDQSGRENDLTVAKAGCYEGTAGEDDYESDAKRRPTQVNGNKVYALYMDKHEGYRDNTTSGMPTGTQPQGVYSVAEGSGKRPGAGCCCCWNFGNASTDNCYGPTGQMNALYLGIGYWGKGTGQGPWYLGDFEAGVWAGGSGPSNYVNPNTPSMTMDYAFGILKTRQGNYAIRSADATTGNISTHYDGNAPANWTMEGGIILGIGGDNSNSSDGTFLEGAITAGRPDDATDALVHENVKAQRYGQ